MSETLEELRFERLERLGAGGMAVVWRALDRKLRREVALKELRDELALHGEGLARFKHEAEAIARLSHPNVVAFHDAIDEGPHMVLVLELVRGQSLDRVLAASARSLRDVVEILVKVAAGVHHAHEQGVIHRDLKPSNVLVGDDGAVKVTDFGLAHLSGDLVTTLTKTGALLGTPAYMAPEQARGDRHAIDRRTDVYGLGAILYEALAGVPPFRADSAHAVFHAVLNLDAVEPRAIRPEVPLDLQTIALKCLSKERDRRYPTALAFAEDLGRWLEGRPIEARPPSRTELLSLWIKRNPSRSALVAALFVSLAGASGSWGLRWRESNELASKLDDERLARERAVSDEIARVRSGTAGEDAVDRVVAIETERTVELLEAALAVATDELARPTRAAYVSANELTPEEASAGAKPIEGLKAVLDRTFATGEYDDRDLVVFRAAIERLEARALRALPQDAGARAPDVRTLLAAAQRQAGEGTRRVATFACEALGRLKRERSARPIARYLGVVASEVDACVAGEALARIGGASATTSLLAASRRFGTSSLFWSRVGQRLGQHVAIEAEAVPTASSYRRSGVAKASAHDLDGAIADLTSAIALDSRDAFAWYNRAAARFEKRDLDGALSDASRAVQLMPEDGGMLGLRGSVRRARGDAKGALADLDRAVELDPSRTTIWVARGLAHMSLKDDAAAVADLTSALAIEPGNLGALNNRGSAKKHLRDFAGAVADWTRAIALDPRCAAALANRGGYYAEQGEVERALADLDRALSVTPKNVEALANRGRVRAKQGDLEAAFADLDRAVKLAPSHAAARWIRGQVKKDASDFAGAIEDLRRAHELSPKSGAILDDLATVRRLAGDLDGALGDYARALELEPELAMTWYNRGVARGLKGDLDGEIADVTRALELDAAYLDAYAIRAVTRAKKGDRDGALADADRGIDLAPASPFAWSARARTKGVLGDMEGAIADASRALELAPRDTDALVTRGRARAASGDKPGAISDLKRYLELAPKSPSSETVRKELAALESGKESSHAP